MKPDRDRESEFRALRTTALLSGIGLTLALSIGIGVGLGYLLDQWWKTHGVAVIGGALLGIVAGFKQMLRIVGDASRAEEQADRSRRDQQRADREHRENKTVDRE